MRGHLTVGRELVEAGEWEAAEPHFLHPSTEIYAHLAPSILSFGIDPFGDELLLLAGAVVEQSQDEFEQRYAEAEAALSAAVERAGATARTHQLHAVSELLAAAVEEYGHSLEDGKFVNAAEYQDSLGFVLVAEEMVSGLEAPEAELADVKAALGELKKAWPSPVPPEAPVMEKGAVLAAVSRVQLALSSLR